MIFIKIYRDFVAMKVEIEKLVFGGQGMARVDNKVAFIWNALPGETVEIDVIQNKKTMTTQEAIAFYKNSTDKQNASHTILVEGDLTNKVVYYLFKFIFDGLCMEK
jgi:predicted RNA-binding protein with TRAM domain